MQFLRLYRNESSYPKLNAQRNLMGRTHYVDDDTLRFHHARVLNARHHFNGLLFSIVESVALDMHNKSRGVRWVIFDLFGDTVGTRLDHESCLRRSSQAEKGLYADLDKLDPLALTLAGIERAEKYHAQSMAEMRAEATKAANKMKGGE